MQYTITVELPEPITEAQASDVMDEVCHYDSASFGYGPTTPPYVIERIEFDGTLTDYLGPGYAPGTLTNILARLRMSLGWLKGVRYSISLVD